MGSVAAGLGARGGRGEVRAWRGCVACRRRRGAFPLVLEVDSARLEAKREVEREGAGALGHLKQPHCAHAPLRRLLHHGLHQQLAGAEGDGADRADATHAVAKVEQVGPDDAVAPVHAHKAGEAVLAAFGTRSVECVWDVDRLTRWKLGIQADSGVERVEGGEADVGGGIEVTRLHTTDAQAGGLELKA